MKSKSMPFHVRTGGLGTGAISLLVVFTVLGLSMLALLGLSTSLFNQRLGEKSLQSNRQMAQAEQMAALKFAAIDEQLGMLQTEYREDEEGYDANVKDFLIEQGCVLQWAEKTASFTLALNETTQLEYTFKVEDAFSSFRYRVISEILSSSKDWEAEQPGQLWAG